MTAVNRIVSTVGAPWVSAQALRNDTPPASVGASRDFWLGSSAGGTHTLEYSLRTPQGAACLSTNLSIEAIVAKFATNVYYAAYGDTGGILVALSSASHDPAGFTLKLDGAVCADGQPPWQVAVSNLAAGAHTLTVQSKTFPDLSDEATLYVIKVSLVPDYDRDGVIGALDKASAATNEVFRFWINDDDDSGVVGGDDIPGDGTADASNDSVDGIRDLIDFFPVWADIGDALAAFPTNDYTYKLSHASGALNAFACPLLPESGNPSLRPDAYLYSTNAAAAYGGSAVAQVTASGLALNPAYLAEYAATGRGLMLFEGRAAASDPLVLEIRRRSDNALTARSEVALQISGVEQMYRRINLRPGCASSTNAPANNPDALSNGRNVFFVHGFNVSADASRGWNAEMFKRLHWAGSRARFWGMAWEGDAGWPNALNYQENVAKALAVASNFNEQVSGISGGKIVLAHSLGNMVVSAAIQDYGLSLNKYFMLNAAVASECYWPAAFNNATTGNYMLHADWSAYSNKTWCSKWHELFASPDARKSLTWKDRFPSVLATAYNFYSSGDEIFEIHEDPGLFTGTLWHLERYAWQKQELFKGRTTIFGVPVPGGTSWAGWGFSGKYTMAEANAASPDNLRTNAVFRQEPATMFSSNITTHVVNAIIAQGMPALSYAAGRNSIDIPGFYNYNMDDSANQPNGWGRSGEPYNDRWLHNDLKNMAYLYTYILFNELVSQGGL